MRAWGGWFALVAAAGLAIVFGRSEAGAQDHPDLWEQFRLEPAWAPQAIRPESHGQGWLDAHGPASAGGDCANCHTEDSCATCHAGGATRTGLHPPGYLALHAGDALDDSASCTSCHTTTRFCTGCHTELELAGTDRSRPPAGSRVHPDDWLEPNGLFNHATEARGDLLSCAGCHDGNSCMACHIDVNPHGSEFLDRCATMLEAAEPTCASCHTQSSRSPIAVIRQIPGCRR
jgi:hypothetical protein